MSDIRGRTRVSIPICKHGLGHCTLVSSHKGTQPLTNTHLIVSSWSRTHPSPLTSVRHIFSRTDSTTIGVEVRKIIKSNIELTDRAIATSNGKRFILGEIGPMQNNPHINIARCHQRSAHPRMTCKAVKASNRPAGTKQTHDDGYLAIRMGSNSSSLSALIA